MPIARRVHLPTAQLKGEGRGVVRDFPAFGDVGPNFLPVGIPAHQLLAAHDPHHIVWHGRSEMNGRGGADRAERVVRHEVEVDTTSGGIDLPIVQREVTGFRTATTTSGRPSSGKISASR